MKLNKSLLVGTLVASTVLLAACNEKNKAETTPTEPVTVAETQAQPDVQGKTETTSSESTAIENTQSDAQEKTETTSVETTSTEPTAAGNTQPESQEKVVSEKSETVVQEILNQFNNTVTIQLVGYQSEKIEGEDTLSFVYNVKNKGDKAIKELQWYNLVFFNSTLVEPLSIAYSFEDTLAPEGEGEIKLTKLAKTYAEEIRADILKPEANLQFSPIIAGRIIFEDGTQLVVTTDEELTQSLQQILTQ
uniref:LppA n=1 Tax=Histophilus somni TaxID=731 RepID=Q53566_HISSO|nr:LppA [Histophilus somni]